MRELCLNWLADNKLGKCKPSTYHFYCDIANQIPAYISENATSGEVQDYLVHLSCKGYSTSRMKNILLVIKFVRPDIICTIPATPIRKPLKLFNAEQVKIFHENCTGKYRSALISMLGTGIRAGELLGLTRTDIDLQERMLYIQHSFYKGKLGTPKSRSSVRCIPISTIVFPEIESAYNLAGNNLRIYPYSYNALSRAFEKSCIDLGLPHIGLHGLRHTFATSLINAGINIKVVSELLGHASVQITLDIYYHPSIYDMRNAVESLIHT